MLRMSPTSARSSLMITLHDGHDLWHTPDAGTRQVGRRGQPEDSAEYDHNGCRWTLRGASLSRSQSRTGPAGPPSERGQSGKIPAVSGDRGYLPLNRGFWVGLRRRTWAQSVSAGEPELSGPGSRFMILGGEMSTTCAQRFPQVIHNSDGCRIAHDLRLQSYPQVHGPYNTNNPICLIRKGILAFDDHRRYSS